MTTDAAPSPNGYFKRQMTKQFALAVGGIGAMLVLWQLSVPLVHLSSYFYPSPKDVLFAFYDLSRKGILSAYLVDSISRYAIAVLFGTAIGIGVGLAIGRSPFLSKLLGPLINFFYAIVEVVWIPLLVIWWGYGQATIVTALIYVSAFPVLYNTLAGVRAIPQVYINALLSLGGNWLHVLAHVILPGSLPQIITGFRVGASFAFRGLIFAEMIAAGNGLGFLISDSATHQQTNRSIVGMIVMGLLWLFIDNVYLKPFEWATIERWGTVTKASGRD